MSEHDDAFFSRWSRRKAAVREGVVVPPEPPVQEPSPVVVVAESTVDPAAEAPVEAEPPPPPPTLADVEALTPTSDFSRFVAADVDVGVKNAALKKLFADPHFNVMDGLDTYIDDYGKPDPLPASMLRQLAQSQFLGLFTEAPPPPLPADEDADLRLQPHDAAGCPAPGPDAEPDPGRDG